MKRESCIVRSLRPPCIFLNFVISFILLVTIVITSRSTSRFSLGRRRIGSVIVLRRRLRAVTSSSSLTMVCSVSDSQLAFLQEGLLQVAKSLNQVPKQIVHSLQRHFIQLHSYGRSTVFSHCHSFVLLRALTHSPQTSLLFEQLRP